MTIYLYFPDHDPYHQTEIDPTAYHCGFNDWLDSEISNDVIEEIDDKYYLK